MFIKNQSDKNSRTLLRSELKGIKQIEALGKFKENMIKKRKRIEDLYESSVANQIYIFPRGRAPSTSSSESDCDDIENASVWLAYDLKSQNRKNKNYQTSSSAHFRCTSLSQTQKERLESKNKLEMQQSQKRKKIGKDQSTSNYHSRGHKEKKDDKTVLNSGKKGIISEQFSLGCNQGHTKKGSETIIVSFRGKQKEGSRCRMKTEMM